jgi:cobalt/nickel transport system permease protein
MHRRDPRAKAAVLLVFLVVLTTTRQAIAFEAAGAFLLLVAGLRWARLPVASVLVRGAVVLPFAIMFGAVSWLAGDPARAISLLLKTYLSALAVLLLVSTTPLPVLLRGLESAGVPRFFLMVTQFLYRYLFVISEEAQHMARAAASRGASVRRFAGSVARFRAAAGALAILFSKSYGRAEQIHRAMLSRGFEGHLTPLDTLRFGRQDALFLTGAVLACVLVRAAAEGVA